MSTGPRPEPPRVVKPRKLYTSNLPLIAVDRNAVLTERGEHFAYSELSRLVSREPSSIFVTHLVGQMVRELTKVFEDDPRWQFRASPVEREVWGPNKKYRTTIRDTTVACFGFTGVSKKRGKYHYPISPQTFVLKTANDIRRNVDEPPDTLLKLMEWGKDLRAFLLEQKLILRPTTGGIAGQLLRDERFYPKARRKVPRRTNAAAREQLPGNFYRLYDAKVGRAYKAVYLDQTSAHHNVAQAIQFPDANTLRRRGRYASLSDRRPFKRAGSDNFDKCLQEHGLFYLGVEVPHFRANVFPLPCLDGKRGYRRVYVYSNELEYLRECRVTIRHIIAQWTSPNAEAGLNRYGEWAADEIAKSGIERKPWLKPTLLAPYGVLAARPKPIEFGYHRAENAIEKKYPCGSGFLTVQARRMARSREMPTANVIHRGMIEAETRLRSLRLARELAKLEHSILAIYADSLFVNGSSVPLLSPPWRVQHHLTALRFLSATAFTSMEISKLPGIALSDRRRARLPGRPRNLRS